MRWLLAVVLVAATTGVAAAKEARVSGVAGSRVTLDRGRDAGVVTGASCGIFLEVTVASQRKLVQVARCKVLSAEAKSATASVSDQQGSVNVGYVAQVTPPAPPKKTPTPTVVPPTTRPGSTPASAPAPVVTDEIPAVVLANHWDFHKAAERYLADPSADLVYEATFKAGTVDVGPHDQLLGLAPLYDIFPFPGNWHSCLPRPAPTHCALTIPADDPVSVRVDEAGYTRLRNAVRSGDVELRAIFRVRAVKKHFVMTPMEGDCATPKPFDPAPSAYDISIEVLGGTLKLTRDGTTLLLLKSFRNSDGAIEVRFGTRS
jgi:hypothetical protein